MRRRNRSVTRREVIEVDGPSLLLSCQQRRKRQAERIRTHRAPIETAVREEYQSTTVLWAALTVCVGDTSGFRRLENTDPQASEAQRSGKAARHCRLADACVGPGYEDTGVF